MSALVYKDQSAKDLWLHLIPGACADLPALVVLSEMTISFNEWTIRAGILGASHFMSVRKGSNDLFTEVFACVPTLHGGIISTPPFANGDRASYERSFDGVRYLFEGKVVRGRERLEVIMPVVYDDAASPFHRAALIYQFPTTHEKEIPVTIVIVDEHKTGATLSSAHYYPNESSGVFTTSQVTWKGD